MIGDFAVRQRRGGWRYICALADGTTRDNVTFAEYCRRRTRDGIPLLTGPLKLVMPGDNLWHEMIDAFLEALAKERHDGGDAGGGLNNRMFIN